MNVKPILIVFIGNIHYSRETIEYVTSEIKAKIENEYHVLIVPKYDIGYKVEFQVFYDKNFTEINYEELKSVIMKSISDKELRS